MVKVISKKRGCLGGRGTDLRTRWDGADNLREKRLGWWEKG